MTELEQHLKDRHFNTSLHKVWLLETPSERSATFPLWNLSGQLVGYQRYRPDATKEKKNDPREGRYFTRVKDRRVGVWGLESWRQSAALLVTEGIFDAARLTNAGWAAIGVLSYDINDTTRSWLSILRQHRTLIAVCDGDSSGKKLSKYTQHAIMCPDDKDVGSLSDQEFEDLQITLNEYTKGI